MSAASTPPFVDPAEVRNVLTLWFSFSLTVEKNPVESSNAPSTSATDGFLRRGTGIMSLPGLSDYYPKIREQQVLHDSANPVDEDF